MKHQQLEAEGRLGRPRLQALRGLPHRAGHLEVDLPHKTIRILTWYVVYGIMEYRVYGV